MRDQEILWRYLSKMNEIKPCPRSALLDVADGNEYNLGKWLYHLIDEDQLAIDEWIGDRLFYTKTDRGKEWHWIMQRHRDCVSRMRRYTGQKMKPLFRIHEPPPRPIESMPGKQAATT
jgi:hypothetical protein